MNLAALELEFIRSVVRRQTDRPCTFSRTETGLKEFGWVTHRVARLERWELRLLERDLDRLFAVGFLCEVCRWKLCLFAAFWFSEKLPFVALRFRSHIPARSQLLAAGRDLEAEIEAAIHLYRYL